MAIFNQYVGILPYNTLALTQDDIKRFEVATKEGLYDSTVRVLNIDRSSFINLCFESGFDYEETIREERAIKLVNLTSRQERVFELYEKQNGRYMDYWACSSNDTDEKNKLFLSISK